MVFLSKGQAQSFRDRNGQPIGDTDPAVRRVLPNLEPLVFPIWLVAHRDFLTRSRIRRVYDVLAQDLNRSELQLIETDLH